MTSKDQKSSIINCLDGKSINRPNQILLRHLAVMLDSVLWIGAAPFELGAAPAPSRGYNIQPKF